MRFSPLFFSPLDPRPVSIHSSHASTTAQRAIAHLTIDGRKRIAVDMPEGWSLVDFLTSIEQRHQKYSIRRRSGNQTVFTLDLAAHARFLRDLASRNKEANETRSFRHFINDILVDGSDWKDSVNSWDSAESLLVSCLTIFSVFSLALMSYSGPNFNCPFARVILS